MKRILITVVLVLVAANSATAATVSAPAVNTSATVDGALAMTVVLRENSSTGNVVTSIDYGQLGDTGTGTLRSNSTVGGLRGSVVAMVTVNSHKVPYTVSQTGTTMTSAASDTLPAGACVVTPVYAIQDNGGAALPTGASVGAGGSYVSTAKVLYTSGAGGDLRTFQAHYSITDDPAAGSTDIVPVDQPAGSYAGTVTITVTT